MRCHFEKTANRRLEIANYNNYAAPTAHPDRIMDAHDFIYLRQGEWIIGQNGETFTVRPGDVLLLSAGLHHYPVSLCSPGTQTMYIHAPELPGDRCLSQNEAEPPGGVTVSNFIRTGGSSAIEPLFHKIILAYAEQNEDMASAYFSVLLYELSAVGSGMEKEDLARSLQSMILSSGGMPKVEELAAACHVSPKTAERAFHAAFGLSLHQYILQTRIRQAQENLLHFPEMTLSAMAKNLGFYDEYHLSRQFKRICGISPSQYRKEAKK